MACPTSPAGWLAMMTLAYLPNGLAAEGQQEPAAGALPSLELLEFLGGFETDSGEWVNPGELMTPEFEQLLKQLEGAPDQASGSNGNGNRNDGGCRQDNAESIDEV